MAKEKETRLYFVDRWGPSINRHRPASYYCRMVSLEQPDNLTDHGFLGKEVDERDGDELCRRCTVAWVNAPSFSRGLAAHVQLPAPGPGLDLV
jgi:hypothetical protein